MEDYIMIGIIIPLQTHTEYKYIISVCDYSIILCDRKWVFSQQVSVYTTYTVWWSFFFITIPFVIGVSIILMIMTQRDYHISNRLLLLLLLILLH